MTDDPTEALGICSCGLLVLRRHSFEIRRDPDMFGRTVFHVDAHECDRVAADAYRQDLRRRGVQ